MSEQTIALALIAAACCWLAYWAAQVTVEFRAVRDARWDVEDAPINHGIPLPAPDAPDEVFDDWGRRVLGLRLADPFAITRAQIAALETTEEAS